MTIGNTAAIPLGTEFRVNTYTTDAQKLSSVTSLADGGFVVTWASYGQDTDGYGIYGQRYDSAGAIVGSEFLVNSTTTTTQSVPSITSLADGGFVVAWESYGQDTDAYGIFGQRYDAAGASVGAEFQINTTTAGDQKFASITSLADGGFVVTWTSNGQDGSYWGIYGQRFDAAGLTDGSEFLINTTTASTQYIPSVTSLNDGGFVVTWMSYGQDGTNYGSYGQRYDAAGDAVASEFQINSNVAADQSYPTITSLADGGFVVAWHSYLQDGSSGGVYGQRYDAAGVRAGTEFKINTYTSGDQSNPVITSLADGGFVVAWGSYGKDGDNYGVYGQRYDAAGDSVGAEFQISTYTTGLQYLPSIASLADGGFVVTWDSNGQDGYGYGVYGQQFAAQLFGTAGDDIITDSVGANWIDGQGGNDTLSGGKGKDKLFGGSGDDVLNGGTSRDKLAGGLDNDTLNGGGASDGLNGNKGTDILNGGNGNDTLTGGRGKDTLTGGAGADVFVYKGVSDSKNSQKADTIMDFDVGIDDIDLSAFGGLSFVGIAGFSATGAEVRIGNSGGDTVVRVDVDGDGVTDMKIVLSGALTLTVDDFIL